MDGVEAILRMFIPPIAMVAVMMLILHLLGY